MSYHQSAEEIRFWGCFFLIVIAVIIGCIVAGAILVLL